MITLNKQTEDYWIELGAGVQLKVRPLTHSLYLRARAMATARVMAAIEDEEDTLDEAGRKGLYESEHILALARLAVTDWKGVVDEDEQPLPVTPDLVDELLNAHWLLAERFNAQYNGSRELMAAEKKPSGGPVDGSSAVA